MQNNNCDPALRAHAGNQPLVHRFQVSGTEFLLDVHTNRIFHLSAAESEVLDRWLGGARLCDIATQFPREVAQIERLQSEGVFCAARPTELAFGGNCDELFDEITHLRQQTILELTQQCNLRCRYCTFGGGFVDHRAHSERVMSESVIEAAVLAALSHGDRLDEIVIGFYGGEPLNAWGSLVTAVRTAQKHCGSKRVRFSLTTNGTLLDDPKCRFLSDCGAHVLVSLDGPSALHDRHRVFPDGRGSYTETLRGLKCLLDAYPLENHSLIALNMVVPGPEWFTELERLWEDEPWIPTTLQAQANVVTPPVGYQYPVAPTGCHPELLEQRWLARLESGAQARTTLSCSQIDVPLARLHQRSIFRDRQGFFPNGCCVPGLRRIYVETDGTYRLCERVHGLPKLGNVTGGLDFEAIQQLVHDFCVKSLADCQSCWAVSLCRLCYGDAYEGGVFNLEKKRRACEGMRNALQRELQLYCLTSLHHPSTLEEWTRFQIR